MMVPTNTPPMNGTLDDFTEMTELRKLRLMSAGVQGTLPAAWGALPRLEEVDLYGNSISGSLPKEWATGSGSIKKIRLDDNADIGVRRGAARGCLATGGGALSASVTLLHSRLPAAAALRRATTSAPLAQHPVQGSIPPEWTSAAAGAKWSLTHLQVSYCGNIEGPLPAIWSMPALQWLGVAGTKITGGLARVVNGSPSLELLMAFECPQLSEEINEAWRFDLLPNFGTLQIHNSTGLTGTLPNSARRARPGQGWCLPAPPLAGPWRSAPLRTQRAGAPQF